MKNKKAFSKNLEKAFLMFVFLLLVIHSNQKDKRL